MDEEKIRTLLSDKDSYIRSIAFDAIKTSMTDEEIQKYTDDENTSILCSAYLQLIKRGNQAEVEEIEKKIKSKEQKSSILGSLGIALYSDKLDEIRIEILKNKSQKELINLINWQQTTSHLSYIVLAELYSDSVRKIIRQDILDDFKGREKGFKSEWKRRYGEIAEMLLIGFNKDSDYFKCSLYKSALKALSIIAQKEDLDIAEMVLDRSFPYYEREIHQSALNILSDLGNSKNVALLIEFSYRTEYKELKVFAAELALRFSGRNKAEVIKSLIDHDLPEIVKYILVNINKTLLANIEQTILNLLYNKNDDIRVNSLSFYIRNSNRQKIEKLLSNYLKSDTYYYNIVCWLDRYLYCPGKLGDEFRKQLMNFSN